MSPVSVTVTPPATVSVIVGTAPAVIVGGTAGYQFTQVAPSATWTINHNLGYFPLVQTFNTGNAEVEGAVVHLSPNTTQVSFVTPIAGPARAV